MNDLSQDLHSLTIDPNKDHNESNFILSKQDTIESNTSDIIDDNKMAECEQNDSDYLDKENLINLLKIYKQMILNYKTRIKEQSVDSENHALLNIISVDNQITDEDFIENFLNKQIKNDLELEMINQHLKTIIKTHLRCTSKIFLNDEDDLENEDTDLPKNVIITQLPNELFANLDTKSEFENLFFNIDQNCKFCYFRIFKRCLIQFEDPILAVLARFELDDYLFLNDRLRVFLTKPIKFKNSRPYLEPPKNDKTFLISPPSSPPIGWEQTHEDPPVINYDLLAALAKLAPDEPCELIKSSNDVPGIVVHPCPDLPETPDNGQFRRKYIPTRRPAFDF